MTLKSLDDVKALIEYSKIDQLQRIEKKLKRLSYAPVYACGFIMGQGFWSIWNNETSITPSLLLIVGLAFAVVGQANVKRTDLMRKLFELKYGK